MNEMENRKRFRELLPWHVNGTLDADGRRWVDDYARHHPEAAAELQWCRGLQARVCEAVPEIPADLGLDRLMVRIRAEPRTARPAARTADWGERLRGFFAGLRLSPAFAVAATVVVAQAAVIGALLSGQGAREQEFSTVRSVESGPLVVIGSVLQVSFRADVTEREMRALLVEIGGSLVGGPGQLGNYLIAVPADKVERARQQLADSPLVEDVTVLPHLLPVQ